MSRLFSTIIFLTLALTSVGQELFPEYTGEVFFNSENKTLSGEINISAKTPVELSYLPIENWVQAVVAKNSDLAREYLNNQNTSLYFSDPSEQGNSKTEFQLLVDGVDSEYSIEHSEDLTTITPGSPIKAGSVFTLVIKFNSHLPERKFGGFGADQRMINLTHCLPRLSTFYGKFHPIRANIRQHSVASFYKAEINLKTNLNLEPEGHGEFVFSRIDTLANIRWTYEGKGILGFSLVEHAAYENLRFSGPNRSEVKIEMGFIQANSFGLTPNSIEKIQSFLYQEGYPTLPNNLKVRVIENKYHIKSHPEILWVEPSDEVHQAELNLISAWLEAYWLNELMINDHLHPWVTQGFIQKAENDFLESNYPDLKLLGWAANTWAAKFFDVDQYKPTYQTKALNWFMERQGFSQPLSDSASTFPKLMYQSVVVGKGSQWLATLENIAGDVEYKRGLKKFFESELEHPTPKDILNAVDYYTNENVDWFLADGYKTNGIIDYALVDNEKCSYIQTVKIKNKGDITLPVRVTGIKNEKPVISEVFDSIEKVKTVNFHLEDYDYLMVDYAGKMPDINEKNNTTHTRKFFRGFEPLRLQFYTSLEAPHKTQVFWFPSLKFNAYDKLLPGIRIYNRTLIPKKFEYWLGPDYSLGTGKLTGTASFKFNFASPKTAVRLWSLGLYTRYYHYAPNLAYFRISPALNFYFKKDHPRSTLQRNLKIRYVQVDREVNPMVDPNTSLIATSFASYKVANVQMIWDDVDILSPYKLVADAQYSNDFTRFSVEYDKRWMLPNKRWLIWRTFAAKMWVANEDIDSESAYFSMGLSGTRDYLFDHYFIGRSDTEGLWSRQFFVSDGGFKSNTYKYGTNFMLTTGVNIPIWTVFGVFGDIGYVDDFETLRWDYGVRISLLTDFLEIYLPIQSNSNNYWEQSEYLSNSRMVLNLEIDQIIDRVRRGWY